MQKSVMLSLLFLAWICLTGGIMNCNTQKNTETHQTNQPSTMAPEKSDPPILNTWIGIHDHEGYFIHFNGEVSVLFQWKPDYVLYGKPQCNEDKTEIRIPMRYVVKAGELTWDVAPIFQDEVWKLSLDDELLTVERNVDDDPDLRLIDTMKFRKPSDSEEDQQIIETIQTTNQRITAKSTIEERQAEIAAMLTDDCYVFSYPVDNRSFWDTFPESEELTKALTLADEALTEPIPIASDELYLEFLNAEGDIPEHSAVEQKRAEQQRILKALTLAECIKNEGTYVPKIEEIIKAMCAEKSWLHPAIDVNRRNFDGVMVDMDLRSTTLGLQLSVLDSLLGTKLKQEVRNQLKQTLNERIIEPITKMMKQERPPNGWLTGASNWNAVCFAGVTGVYLSQVKDKQQRAWYLAQLELYSTNFLRSFTKNGYCWEGLGYWNYGFGHYMLLSEIVKRATQGALDFMDNAYVETIAEFPLGSEMIHGIYPAIADCPVNISPSSMYMYYLNKRYNWGVKKWDTLPLNYNHRLQDQSIYYYDPPAFFANPLPAEAPPVKLRSWFDEAGFLISRPTDGKTGMCVALKGGHNAENHNHNDVGTYVVVLNDALLLVDPGSEVYKKRTFSAQRYESNVLNSYGHPVPVINGRLQETGFKSQGKILETNFTEASDQIVMDIASAYPNTGLQSLIRSFEYNRTGAGSLTVKDQWVAETPITYETAIITFSNWNQLGENHLEVYEGDARLDITIETDQPYMIEEVIIDEEIRSDKQPIRLGFKLKNPTQTGSFTLHISTMDE